MPRMSAAKRIELGKAMVERWRVNNSAGDRSVRFVEDMLVRLERGRSLTTRQRAWYDSAVMTDPPEPKNKETVDRLLFAADIPGMEKTAQILRDFAYKLARGWNLSEKQVGFMNKLLDEANDIHSNGRWVPTAEEKRDIEIGVAFCRRYDQYYLSGQPGKSKAHRECTQWLSGELDYLDKWSAQKMMNICKGDRKLMTDAFERWPIGTLVVTKRSVHVNPYVSNSVAKGSPGLIIGMPFVNDKGKPVIEVLIDGNPEVTLLDNVSKRNPK